MKIMIVTVYNSENCGSYWQAKVLGDVLSKAGHDVSYLKRPIRGTSHGYSILVYKLLMSVINKDFVSFIEIIKQHHLYSKYSRNFTVVQNKDVSCDAVILGSDTIWNLESKYFKNNYKIYWGAKYNSRLTISYAASIANTKPTDLKQIDTAKLLNSLDAISVRDNYSKRILSDYTNCDIKVVCDPTLLVSKYYYYDYISKNKYGDYLLVYYFGTMPKDLIEETQSFAKRNHLTIVVMGNALKGDYNLYSYSPNDFVTLFYHSSFVVTNTFHGSVFSINFEKQAVFNSDQKNKVSDLLSTFDLLTNDYSMCDSSSFKALIDYERVGKIKETFANYSYKYLSDILA